MAGLIKRKNKWVAVFRNVDGKEIRKTTGIDVVPKALMPGVNKRAAIAQNEARARLVAEEMEKDIKFGVFDVEKVKAIAEESAAVLKARRGEMSVSKYLSSWVESRKNKHRVFVRDSLPVRRFLDFLGSVRDMNLSSVNKGMAIDFVAQEMERVSPGTVIRYVDTLSGAFNAAIDRELISRNPFRGVRPRKSEYDSEKQERLAFTVDEVKKLVEVLPGEWPDMVRVCLYTGGQRLGDIATLKWEQIELKGGVIAMTTQKTKRKMSKPLIAPLKKLLERRMKGRINEFVFPLAAMKFAQGGNRSSKLSIEFTTLLKKHGFIEEKALEEKKGDRRQLAEKSFHSLRATAVTILRLSGVPADLCRFIVGHDSEEIERVYFRPDSADVQSAMDKIANGLEL